MSQTGTSDDCTRGIWLQWLLNRINFNRGRIDPAFQVNASAGADIYQSDRMTMRLQADGQNLNNVLNVIDFGGSLFSGNATGLSQKLCFAPY